MERIAVIDGIRTPFCKMGTSFNNLSAQELGRLVTRQLIERTSLDLNLIDEVIFGNVCQPIDAANVARVIALTSGIPDHVPAYTVHRNCASGMESAMQAALKIKAKQGQCYLVGGTESMSNVPFFLTKPLQEIVSNLSRAKNIIQKFKAISAFRLKYLTPRIGLQLGLTDPVCGMNMGQTAEVLAKEFGLTREVQDTFALKSHEKAIKAKALLHEEIMPVFTPPKYKKLIEDDNGPRQGQSMEALAKLRPVFDRHTGTVTAGNASQITDGAVALLLMSEKKAQDLNIEPLGYIKSFAVAGVEPHRMGIGPAHAIPKALKKANHTLNDMQVLEINEAFAAQVLGCLELLSSQAFANKFNYTGYTGEVNPNILNVHGGAIALGHPVGATGARLILSTLKHMQRDKLHLGCVSLCIGGGQGAAMILER